MRDEFKPFRPFCFCMPCMKWFHPLGIMAHRAAHRRRGEDCEITFTSGLVVSYKFAKPSCYGSNPGPQQRAENDCENCPHMKRCLP